MSVRELSFLIAGALLVLTSAPAFPSGVELAWNACFGKPGATSFATSSCSENTGSQSLIASFVPPAGVDELDGVEVFIDYQVKASSLPCWWNFANGQLRNNQLIPLHVSPTDVNGAPLIPCDNHYFLENGASGGGGMVVTGTSRGQLKGIAAIEAGTGLPVAPGAQQYAAGFRILNGSTMPAGTCDGCANIACFVVNTINLSRFGWPNLVLQSPQPGSEQVAIWQYHQWLNCFPTPILQSTWGAIKSIYR